MADRSLLQAIGTSPLVQALLARSAFRRDGSAFDCAVSGGADSTCLAVLAAAISLPDGIVFRLVHVDHGLRSSASDDARLVVSLAERLGAECIVERLSLGDGPNLEERARDARYAVLAPNVCTGHTADDLAETVILHLMRGAGLDGVASMARVRPGGVCRPLLGLRRADTEALCASLGLSTVADEMNADRRFRRVRVRSEVIPLLSDVADRDVVPLLARHAEVTADDVAFLERLASDIDPTARWGLRNVAPALARRAVRRWLVAGGVGAGRSVDAATLDRVLAVADGTSVACDVEGGWRVRRTDGQLRLARSDA